MDYDLIHRKHIKLLKELYKLGMQRMRYYKTIRFYFLNLEEAGWAKLLITRMPIFFLMGKNDSEYGINISEGAAKVPVSHSQETWLCCYQETGNTHPDGFQNCCASHFVFLWKAVSVSIILSFLISVWGRYVADNFVSLVNSLQVGRNHTWETQSKEMAHLHLDLI